MSVIFPKWTNHLPTIAAAAVVLGGLSVVGIVSYWFSPRHTDVGYAPPQPVKYSHKLHAGLMGMDCRYCHTDVEVGPHANVPTTEVCMNCHKGVRTDSLEVQKIAQAHEASEPLHWQKVHLLPDYAYFHHGVHVNAGVGCQSCHGRMDEMEVVRQVEPLNMGWCLECHRQPEAHIRPIARFAKLEPELFERAVAAGTPEGELPAPAQVTQMGWSPSLESIALARRLRDTGTINPPEHCSACHR
ncbi:MAG: cytochrome c3 family protein [Planctomycetes bacterium]|nr:cytochrome c3 family protein [Planctomycetota bacterium]